jgi:carboxylesterase type B
MLFIHGGNFQYQGADSPLIDGRLYANYTDTIIVTVQYRLGML